METGETDFRKVPNLVESSKVIDLNPIAPVARCLTSIHQSMVDLSFTYAWHTTAWPLGGEKTAFGLVATLDGLSQDW